jgi:hypothetical protein
MNWATASPTIRSAPTRETLDKPARPVVACAQCGRTETFTLNAAELASWYSGSQQLTTTRT